MTLEEVKADYRDSMRRTGWLVKLRKTNPIPFPHADFDVFARIVDYGSREDREIANGMKQGSKQAIVLAEDLEAAGFPLPFETNGTHKIIDGSRVYNIEQVDETTRKFRGVVVAYELVVLG